MRYEWKELGAGIAQQNVPPLSGGYSDYYRSPREMTREDLGPPKIVHAYGRDWIVSEWEVKPDAPYAFWLGADAR